MNDEINKNHISYKFIFFVLKIIYLVISISSTKENKRVLINLSSEINLVIKGGGNQSILNNTFYLEPSRVYINDIYKESCKKFCEMYGEINNIKLIFDNNIESCENMFYGSYNITEIDFSNFDFSQVRNVTSHLCLEIVLI